MKTVVIFGGSGFVGKHIIRRLVRNDYKIIVPYQNNINEPKLKMLGNFGQIIPLRFRSISDILILNQLKHANIVINLKTLWNEKKLSFEEGIFNFNKKLADYIKNNNKNCQFIYFSGIGVEEYPRSKRSEAILNSEVYFNDNLINSIIIRPGIIVGGGDLFIQKLLSILKISFFLPLFGKGKSKFQPVFVDDVSKAISNIINEPILGCHIFDFVGNEIFTYKDFYSLLIKFSGKRRYLISVPFFIAGIIVYILEKTPVDLMSKEQLNLFKKDNISENLNKNLSFLRIKPQDLNEIIKKIVKDYF